jgi:hypothetical protein
MLKNIFPKMKKIACRVKKIVVILNPKKVS